MDVSGYTRYRPLMFSIAYRMTGSVSDAEDIVQEAFLRATKNATRNSDATGNSLFLAAARGGDMSSLFERLAPDVLFYGDSGGLGEITFIEPVAGRDRVAEVVRVQLARTIQLGAELGAAWVNGQPGLLASDADGGLIAVIRSKCSTARSRPSGRWPTRKSSATSVLSRGPGTSAGGTTTDRSVMHAEPAAS
jgi:Sigma-70 region 2